VIVVQVLEDAFGGSSISLIMADSLVGDICTANAEAGEGFRPFRSL
jgi:hypothetical protein